MAEYKSIIVPLNKLIPFEGKSINPYSGHWIDAVIRAESEDSYGREIPIYVRAAENDTYELLTGYTRIEVAKNNNLLDIPVVVVSGLSDDYARRLVASGSMFASEGIDIGEIKKYLYRKSELSQKGTYHIDIHMMHVNNVGDFKREVVYIHEALHGVVGEMLIGYLIGDFFLLTEQLLRISDKMKEKMFATYLKRLGIDDPIERQLYIFKNAYELDVVLSQNDNYMKLVHHCVRAFYTYQYLHKNLRSLTEGLATFMAFMVIERVADEMDDIRLRNTMLTEKNIFLKQHNDESSAVGYYIAKKIFDRHGLEGLVVSAVSATAIPYYNFDLISCSYDEYEELLESFYNCDKRWLKFLSLNKKDVDKVFTDIANDPQISLEMFGCKLSNVESYPARPREYAYTAEYFENYLLFHPSLVSALSSLGFELKEKSSTSIKNDYKSSESIGKVNTFERFFAVFNGILDDIMDGMAGNSLTSFFTQDPIASLEKKFVLELKINTLKHITWYHSMVADESIKTLLQSDVSLSDKNVALIRKYANQFHRDK